jgi:solute carrier family 25 carnitine/acylcarnitine transporter 20/29
MKEDFANELCLFASIFNSYVLFFCVIREPLCTRRLLLTTTLMTTPVEIVDRPVWTRVRKFLAGYVSGCCLVLAGHPFDTIKVRMQSEGKGGRFVGVVDCVQTTVKREGLRGLYKGMGAPLFMTGVVNSVLFGTQFNIVSELVRQRGGTKDDSPTLRETMTAAVMSGALISILVTPMEGIKARLQVQYDSGKGYKGPIDCARQVYRKLGLTKGIYRGWVPVCFSRMSNYAYFGSYFFISQKLGDMVANEDGEDKPMPTKKRGPLPPWAAVIAGGCSGICYWLSCYPMDVVKNKIMAMPDSNSNSNSNRPVYKNMRDAFRQVYRKEGIRGFFVGFTPCAIRAFPANAAAFLGFELAMRILPE